MCCVAVDELSPYAYYAMRDIGTGTTRWVRLADWLGWLVVGWCGAMLRADGANVFA